MLGLTGRPEWAGFRQQLQEFKAVRQSFNAQHVRQGGGESIDCGR